MLPAWADLLWARVDAGVGGGVEWPYHQQHSLPGSILGDSLLATFLRRQTRSESLAGQVMEALLWKTGGAGPAGAPGDWSQGRA